MWLLHVIVASGCSAEFKEGATYFSTNVMLSAISATLFAILLAIMEYADAELPEAFSPPATE